MKQPINNSVVGAALSLGVDDKLLSSALPDLKSGLYDPLAGKEYAYPKTKLADFIMDNYRLITELRAENMELKEELKKFSPLLP